MQSKLHGRCGAVGGGLCSLLLAAVPAQGRLPTIAARFDASVAGGVNGPDGLHLRQDVLAAVAHCVRVLETDVDRARRHMAIEHLMRLGAAAAPAVRLLLRAAPEHGVEADLAVAALGEIVPFVPDAGLRREVAAGLGECFRTGSGLVSLATIARAHRRVELGASGDPARMAALLRSRDPFAIEFACQLVLPLGHRARDLLPLLGDLAAAPAFEVQPSVAGMPAPAGLRCDWRPQVRGALFAAITAIDPDHPAGWSLCVERLDTADTAEQVVLVRRLGAMGAGAHRAAPRLCQLAAGPRRLVACEAITALGMVGDRGPATEDVLRQLAGGDDAQLARRAAAALRLLDAAPPAVSGASAR
jgi:hypothetical protein